MMLLEPGSFEKLRSWWEHLNIIGPSYGYLLKPSETNIVVKSPDHLKEKAIEIFNGCKNNISSNVDESPTSEKFKIKFVRKRLKYG